MDMQVSEIGDVTRVALTGRLDTAGVSRIETRFIASIVPAGRQAVIDLAGVEFLASLGVRMLLATARSLSLKGGKLALYAANAAVMEIIETTALDELVPVVVTESEAVALVKA